MSERLKVPRRKIIRDGLIISALAAGAGGIALLNYLENQDEQGQNIALDILRDPPKNLFNKTITTRCIGISIGIDINVQQSKYFNLLTRKEETTNAINREVDLNLFSNTQDLQKWQMRKPSWFVPAYELAQAPEPIPYLQNETIGMPDVDPRLNEVHLYRITGIVQQTLSYSQPAQIQIAKAEIIRSGFENNS